MIKEKGEFDDKLEFFEENDPEFKIDSSYSFINKEDDSNSSFYLTSSSDSDSYSDKKQNQRMNQE